MESGRVENDQVVDVGTVVQHFSALWSDQDVDHCVRVRVAQIFQERSGEDRVSEKPIAYDKNSFRWQYRENPSCPSLIRSLTRSGQQTARWRPALSRIGSFIGRRAHFESTRSVRPLSFAADAL